MSKSNSYRDTPLWNVALSIEERLDFLLEELTLEEKLQCLGTGCPRIERLGIEPFFVGTEGAHGLQKRHDQSFDRGKPQPTTIFPNPIGMSATWDTGLLRQAGEIVGTEARAVYEKEGRQGGLCLWAPTVDMERDPRWGRTEEAYGEDPYLTGKMASAYIRGMWQIRCGATLKHFYANNVEEGRIWKSSSIDPRNKYEYYLEPFRRAVVEGGAEGIMTAYNEINGVPAILNKELRRIAKDEWGLQHVVCDGGDMKQTVDCHQYFGSHTETIAAGLKAGVDCFTDDLEDVMEGAREALELGLIELSDIDRALRCHFGTMLRLGIFDAAEMVGNYGLNLPEHQAIARRVTQESIVLLKNEPIDGGRLLPLNAEDAVNAKRILAVVGPSADAWFMDWYSGIPPYSVTPLQGIQEAASVIYESGLPQIKLVCGDQYLGLLSDGKTLGLVEETAAEVFEVTLWDKEQVTLRAMSNGLLLTAEDGCDEDENYCEGTVTATSEEAFGWFIKEVFHVGESLTALTDSAPLSPDRIQADSTGGSAATLSLEIGDKFQQILENGSEIILQTWNKGDFFVDEQNRIRLQEPEGFVEQGEPRRVISFIGEDGMWTTVRKWSSDFAGRSGVYETITGARYRTLPPVRPVLVHDGVHAAQEIAAKADTVIFVGGSHPMITCKEEVDRKDIDFPPFQRELLRAMYQVNRRIILALITNVPYAITWEEEHLPAILTMASGSMELGHALADILFGVTAPAGRLNMTWYRNTEQLPDMDDYDIIQGERTYQYFQGDVLYPFGHGLTYADVVIDGMSVGQMPCKSSADEADGMSVEQLPREFSADEADGMSVGQSLCESSADEALAEQGESGAAADGQRRTEQGTESGILSEEMTLTENGQRSYGDMIQVTCTVTNRGLVYTDGVTQDGLTQDKEAQDEMAQDGVTQDGLAQDEVVQLYVTKLDSAVKRPIRQLVGFQRVKALEAGESRPVVFEVPVRDLRYYDTVQRRMLVEPGEYEFQLGRSSQDIVARQTITLPGEPRGLRDGSKWQPADHYDRSRNGYLWEGHLGYTSVVHQGKTVSPTDLFEEVDSLWQNVNEVTRLEAMGEGQDDSLLIEYDCVHIPAGAVTLLLDADAGQDAGVDVYLGEDYMAGYIVSGGNTAAGQEAPAGQAADAAGGNGRHGRMFRQLAIGLGSLLPAGKEQAAAHAEGVENSLESSAGWTGTLRLKCYGDIRICRWKFV